MKVVKLRGRDIKLKPLISLDVFDTAIFRKVFNPTDIFSVVEDKVGNNFRTLRMTAQSAAARKFPYCTLIDIYKELRIPFSPKEEIKAEYENCKANPYILNMYNKAEADYIFISDMYLPSVVIKSMLEKCGYKNPQVYVSCELKAMKSSGSLFTKVEEKLKRKISKHIGDNYYADIKGAQKAKIPEVEYVGPPIYNREVITPSLKNVKLRKLLIDKELSEAPIEEKIGYQFAPLILAFTQSVLNEAKEGQTIFFNARDSFLMYIVARWILKTKKKIKYCRFSRKSCHLANINTNYRIESEVNSKALNFFRTLRVNTVGEIIHIFQLTKDYSSALRDMGVSLDTPLDYTLQKNRIIYQFLGYAQDELFAKARESRKNFKEYIKRIGMKNDDIFVDLGHFGSMQSIIRAITGIRLKGMYVHRYEANDYYKGVPEYKSSFLPKGYLKYYTGIVELIFSEPIGTSIDYTSEGKVILNKDTKYRKDITKVLLKGVISGVKDIINEGIKEVSCNDVLKILDRFLMNPTVEEAKFGNLEIFENGSYDKDESIAWYNKDLIKKGKLKECYNRSYWKPAFKVLMKNDAEYSFLLKEIGK